MKKDVPSIPLLPFTTEEEDALGEKLDAMSLPGLTSYVESARLALANKALDPSWRPRVEHGLRRAEVALQRETERAEEPVVVPEAPVKSKAKAKADAKGDAKAEAAAVEPE
jgi:hypothetical protein